MNIIKVKKMKIIHVISLKKKEKKKNQMIQTKMKKIKMEMV